MTLLDEIRAQPETVGRLLGDGRAAVADAAERIRAADVRQVVVAARGTSDHAAIYAQYLLGTRHRLPVALATPSIVTLYGVLPRFERTLVVGISQSGASPDVVAVLAGHDESTDEATVKTFYRESGRIRLQPENASLEPIYAEHVQILGKVVGVFREL